MLDFQNETLTSKPLKEIINATVIFRREETIDKYREYKLELLNDNDNDRLLSKFSAWVSALFEQSRSMLIDEWENIKQNPYHTIEEIELDLASQDSKLVMTAYRFIDQFLYSKGLIKTDTRENITTRSIIKRNKSSGI